jgi:hypothetical protein
MTAPANNDKAGRMIILMWPIDMAMDKNNMIEEMVAM